MTTVKDRIKSLVDRHQEIVASARNRQNQLKYEDFSATARDQFRPHPKPVRALGFENVPIVVDIQNNYFAELFGFDLRHYYQEPACFVENYLKMNIARYEFVRDDRVFRNEISIWLGTAFETSMLGQDVIFQANEDPYNSIKPVINEPADLERLSLPDFFTSGMMPLAHRLYDGCLELVDGQLSVLFPDWTRGPFSTATFLRGFEGLLVDLLLEPEFAHRLFDFITKARFHWYDQKERYTGISRTMANLYNDEIAYPILSPDLYTEFVYPYEDQISQYHGGVEYWHSCGNVSPMIPQIRKLSGIKMFNSGAWTDYRAASNHFADRIVEFQVHPLEDLFEADENTMRTKIEQIVAAVNDYEVNSFYIRAGGIMKYKDWQQDTAKINQWIDICRDVLANA